MARPGGTHIHGIFARICKGRALFSMFPQEGAGGGTPRPKKLNPASERMEEATPKVAETKRGEKALGRIWRNMIRAGLAPIRLLL